MKKWLINLLIGIILFSTIPSYALTTEEADKYIGMKGVIVLTHGFLTPIEGLRCNIIDGRTIVGENGNYDVYLLEKLNGDIVCVRIGWIIEVITTVEKPKIIEK